MIWKTIVILGCALYVLGNGHHATSEQHIIKFMPKEHSNENSQEHTKAYSQEHHGEHGKISHIGSKKPEHHEEYAWPYPSYEFSYKVHDPHTHDMKGQHETRKGDEVKGEYWLIEPNGHKRTVTYHADKHSGFHANVHYSDDHKHLNHEVKQEEEHIDEGLHEEKKEEEVKEEEVVDEEKEPAPVEEKHEDHSKNTDENREQDEGVGSWIHDRHWGYHGEGKNPDYKHYEEHKPGHHFMHGWYKHEENHKGVASRSAWHGHDNKHERDEKSQEETRSRSEQRNPDNRFAHSLHKSGTIVRENYYHPRFYRHNQH